MTSVSLDASDYTITPTREDHDGAFTKEGHIEMLAGEYYGKPLTAAGSGESDVLTFGFAREADARAFKDAMNTSFVPQQDGHFGDSDDRAA